MLTIGNSLRIGSGTRKGGGASSPPVPADAITDPRAGHSGEYITDPRPGFEGQYITDPRT